MNKGLEALELIRYHEQFGCNRWFQEELDIIEKSLKALEIIKNIPDNYKEGLQYTFQHLLIARKITQEEYNILKEVFDE